MSEFFLQRIEKLERSVRRWRLVSVVLAILLTCSLACGGTFTTVLLMHRPHQRQVNILELEMGERDRVEQAMQEARMQADLAREQAEQALREAEAAKQVFQDL
jgi:hypothetical protein